MASIAVHSFSQPNADDVFRSDTVEMTGVALPLATPTYCYALLLQSDPDNTVNIRFGGPDLPDTNKGPILQPGDSVSISAQDLSQIWVVGADGALVNIAYFTYKNVKVP